MLDHPNSVSDTLVKCLFPDPISPNPVSCASISSIEISILVSMNHAAQQTFNASGKLLNISESSHIVFINYSFSLI